MYGFLHQVIRHGRCMIGRESSFLFGLLIHLIGFILDDGDNGSWSFPF